MGATSTTGTGFGSALNYTNKQLHNLLIQLSKRFSYTFTNNDLIDDELLVQHNFNDMFVGSVTIWDNTNQQIMPDSIRLIDSNSLLINLASFSPLTETWKLVVL